MVIFARLTRFFSCVWWSLRRGHFVQSWPFIVFGLFTAAVFLLSSFWLFFGIGKNAQSRVVFIPKQSNATQIARLLEKEDVIADHQVFLFLSTFLKANGLLRSGEYRFAQSMSLYDIINHLKDGDVVLHSVTIPEGSSVYQVLEYLNEEELLQGEIKDIPKEGTIFPDTYRFARGTPRDSIIVIMQKKMKGVMDELWVTRTQGLPIKTKEEALILASIVERETGHEAERKRIAAIFYNRLRLGIALQSDPTLIYWESDRKGFLNRGLRRSELKASHPYNSYKNRGLPPTPIANPGHRAIEAVLNPIETKELYFVANGKGGHAFAKTLKEHNRNVVKWREIERNRKNHN